MHKAVFGLLPLLVSVAPAQAKEVYAIEIAASEGQAENWVDGSATIENVMSGSRVVFSQRSINLPGKPSTFVIVVFNQSDQPIVFGPESVTLEIGEGTKIAMTNPALLETKLRRDIKRRKALAIIGGAFSAEGSDGRTTDTFTYNGNSSTGVSIAGTGTYTRNDPALAQQQQQAAEAEAIRVARAIEARKQSGEEALDWMVRKHTIAPGEAYGGWLAFETRPLRKPLPAPIKVAVTLGSEQHTFAGTLSKAP
jgi:hypothetical protein